MMTQYNENISRLIVIPEPPVVKPPMYRSVFTDSIKMSFKCNKTCHKTMGYAEIQLNSPSEFLKKHSRKVVRPFVEINKVNTLIRPLPNKNNIEKIFKSRPINSLVSINEKKNIKHINIVDAIRKVPPLSKHKVQDTRNGHVIILDEAGLEPTYVSKKTFGKTPGYIFKLYKEKENKKILEVEKNMAKKPALMYIPEQERNLLLNGLKTNWTKLQREFQRLPMLTDTIKKKKKKTKLEKQLKDLERDIDLIDRNPVIYVCRDVNDKD
ncbi:enkurin-like [Daktulosphaira vitifoliae]|uniref:enkurin-like n=1 Tax=Daktulosphaira vitifoliae TaxID=58002 RepID=UPI0021A9DB8A|nr:enkurin-like [Daktulosphaira vitifoliae]